MKVKHLCVYEHRLIGKCIKEVGQGHTKIETEVPSGKESEIGGR